MATALKCAQQHPVTKENNSMDMIPHTTASRLVAKKATKRVFACSLSLIIEEFTNESTRGIYSLK